LLLGLAGCGGAQSAPAPFPTTAIAYAALVRVSDPQLPVRAQVFPTLMGPPSFSYAQLGGSRVRFDAASTLWDDQGSGLLGIRPDHSLIGPLFDLQGSLLAFDPSGRAFVSGAGNTFALPCCSYGLGIYLFSSNAAVPSALAAGLGNADFPCSAAADAFGNLYVATCAPVSQAFESVSAYDLTGPSGVAGPFTHPTATGPVAVDPSGNIYAIVGSSIGMWSAGHFGASVPDRTLALGAVTVFDLAVDGAQNVFVVTKPLGAPPSASATLSYFPAGTGPLTLLQPDAISVAVPLH
jgi:hypothetical protein